MQFHMPTLIFNPLAYISQVYIRSYIIYISACIYYNIPPLFVQSALIESFHIFSYVSPFVKNDCSKLYADICSLMQQEYLSLYFLINRRPDSIAFSRYFPYQFLNCFLIDKAHGKRNRKNQKCQ